MRSKEFRRDKEKLYKDKAKNRVTENMLCCNSEPSDRQIGVQYQTKTLCSCYMCGNPRKFNGNSKASKTPQELKHNIR
jgi:hypothetical protein